MKKGYLALLLLPLGTLASCSSSNIDDPIQYNIDLFSKGFLMKGFITQTRYTATSYSQNPLTGEYTYTWSNPETNEYETDVGFQNVGRDAFEKKSFQDYEGETMTIEDYAYFEDENGYAYTENLNHKNEVEKDYSINYSTSSFEYNGFYNFFSIIEKGDLLNNNGSKRYYLNEGKAGIIVNNLLYSLNSGFATKVDTAYFTMDKNLFKSLTVNMASYIYSDSGTFYKVDNEVLFNFSNIGTYKIEGAASYSDKGYTSLSKALKDLGNNYTMKVTTTSNDAATKLTTTSYAAYYLTGEEIYVHNYANESDSALNKNKDFYLSPDDSGLLYSYFFDSSSNSYIKKAGTGFAQLYQGKFAYEDYVPLANEVSSDMFVYEDGGYTAEEDVGTLLASCFFFQNLPFKNNASGNSSGVKITLSNDSLETVTLPFYYTDFMEGTLLSGNIKIEFSNIGSTVNPKL